MSTTDTMLREWLGGVPYIDPAVVRRVNRMVRFFDTEDVVRASVERVGSWLSDWFTKRMPQRIRIQLEISEPESGSSRLVICPEHRRLTIGRSHSADVRVSDPSVSSCHLAICADSQEGLICEDFSSANGTRIDSTPFRDRYVVKWPGRYLLELGRVSIVIQRAELPAVTDPIRLRAENIWFAPIQDPVQTPQLAGLVFDLSGSGGIRMSLACPASAATALLALLLDGDLDGEEGIPGPIERMIMLSAAGSIINSIRKDFGWAPIQLLGVRTEGFSRPESNERDSLHVGIPVKLWVVDREYPVSIRCGLNSELSPDTQKSIRVSLLDWFSDTPILCAFVAGHVALPLSICNGLAEGDALLVPFASSASWDGQKYTGNLRLAVIGGECLEIAEGFLMLRQGIDSMKVHRVLPVHCPVRSDVELWRGGEAVTQEHACDNERNLCGEVVESLSIELIIELARCRIPLKQVLSLKAGEVIDLPGRLNGEVEIYCGMKHFGSGRLMQVGERLGVQITQIIADSVKR